MRTSLILCILLIIPTCVLAHEQTEEQLIRLATTTSVENSGLLEHLLPKFIEAYPYKIKLVVVGSGKALRLGRTGDVDVVWVHSPASEKSFVEEGYGVNHQSVMRNDFVLVGPEHDPGNIASFTNILDAMKSIASKKIRFISRADDSGTNKKELSLWKHIRIDPYATDWYVESGAGMAATLSIAQEEKAYLMIDRATFTVRHAEGFSILLEDRVNLANPYSVIAVNPLKNPAVNLQGANQLISWLISSEGQNHIASYRHAGEQLYYPTRLTLDN
ncbi:MAG: substrate-binding domain-containing protein [Gammaproteobacteria bacterium]|nr:substrate-binding domain-containing protein [Gammaproteobacteria bacterium]